MLTLWPPNISMLSKSTQFLFKKKSLETRNGRRQANYSLNLKRTGIPLDKKLNPVTAKRKMARVFHKVI